MYGIGIFNPFVVDEVEVSLSGSIDGEFSEINIFIEHAAKGNPADHWIAGILTDPTSLDASASHLKTPPWFMDPTSQSNKMAFSHDLQLRGTFDISSR
jgi:hypothetical protein